MRVLRRLLGLAGSLLAGGGLGDLTRDLADAYLRYQQAESSVEKAEIEKEITQIKTVRDLQIAQSDRLWSPMMVGQYLIVVPFGLWWSSVYLVSILNHWLEPDIVIQDVPRHFFDFAVWLVPALLVGVVAERKLKR